MAAILTVENEFKHSDAASRKQAFNDRLAQVISAEENSSEIIPFVEKSA